MKRAQFVEPARLKVLAEAYCYHRVEAGLATKFLVPVQGSKRPGAGLHA